MLPALALVLVLQTPDALAAEWDVRAAARAPSEHVAELQAGLRSSAWRARARALDALARGAEGNGLPPELVPLLRGALADPHPNVRTRALEVAGAARLALTAEELARLAQEPLASLRLALATALELAPAPDRAAVLASLCADPDERVRRAAENALCGLEPDEPGVGAARLAHLARVDEGAPLAGYALRLTEAPLDAAFLAALRGAGAELTPTSRAQLEALAFAHGARGDGALLVAGARTEAAWEPASAKLLARAARARSRELAAELLAELARDAHGPNARRGLVGLFCDSLGREACAFLRAAEPSPELLAELLGELGTRQDAWDEAALEPWTNATTPLVLRRALLAAVVGGAVRSASPSALRLLARFLADPEEELAARAFDVASGLRSLPAEGEEALFAAWNALDAPVRLARLAGFTRERAFPRFFADWCALGRANVEARAALCELLAQAEGDAAVERELGAWLAADLARLDGGAPERALEQRVMAELRALARVGDATPAPEPFQAALAAALACSTDIGKVAAAGLGKSSAGQGLLAELLARGALDGDADRRTRIEVCIALARGVNDAARAEACARLLAEREAASWELRERMLRALSDSGEAKARRALAELALAPALESVERVALVGWLATHPGAEARAALRALAGPGHELEVRRVALQALAERGDVEALLELFAARVERAGTSEVDALAAGEARLALARLAELPAPAAETLCAEWLQAPLARAGADLALRFGGGEPPATEFAWRHELELAPQLARHGGIERALLGAGPYERLDGRLLLALGESLEGPAPAAAEALLAAGVRALLGEPDPDAARLAWARARRLALSWRLGRHAAAADLAARTLSARRAGALSDSAWARLFGSFDPQAGIDPDARVRAAMWQAHAQDALTRGALSDARAAAARAATALGVSRLAAEAQAELERALAAAEDAR